MNLQTWAKWVAEIDAMTGGAIVELRPGPYGGMKIGVRWVIGKEQYGYEHAMSLGEMERMVEAAQPCVLEQITHAVRRMTPNVELDAYQSLRVSIGYGMKAGIDHDNLKVGDGGTAKVTEK